MPLQFDSTVHYVTGKNASVGTTDAERATNSPYNTYLHTGLPPGPIASPGGASLDAVHEPPARDWLDYVSVYPNPENHKLAQTWDEHDVHARDWQSRADR